MSRNANHQSPSGQFPTTIARDRMTEADTKTPQLLRRLMTLFVGTDVYKIPQLSLLEPSVLAPASDN